MIATPSTGCGPILHLLLLVIGGLIVGFILGRIQSARTRQLRKLLFQAAEIYTRLSGKVEDGFEPFDHHQGLVSQLDNTLCGIADLTRNRWPLWIPCIECMPEPMTPVFVVHEGQLDILMWSEAQQRWCASDFMREGATFSKAWVSKWMPFPDPSRGVA